MLLTRDVISNKTRKENVINTFNTLLDMGIVPIINANDTVSIQELDFDENDTLSAIVAALCSADLLIILMHKQRVQIAFGIHRREADDLVPFVQCSYVVIASQ